MPKQAITRPGVAAPTLPFSAGVRANGFVFTAGQVGTDPTSGRVAGPDVQAQTRQAIENVRAVLEAGGSGLDKLVKVTVFLADMRTFEGMNEVYRELIPEPRPGRSTVEARLARPELLVEIEAVAVTD
jgi:2-iminobutanoate/2-iminopropanoate deaminase